MSPLEFMQRLAALMPRPRLHLIRLHGVLAPNAKLRLLRSLVVPQGPLEQEGPANPMRRLFFCDLCDSSAPLAYGSPNPLFAHPDTLAAPEGRSVTPP